MAEPFHQVHLSQKRRMQRYVVGIVVLLALVYVAVLLPQPLLDHVAAQLVARYGYLAKVASDAVGATVLTSILIFFLFASDSAFNGANRTAQWVRSRYASYAAVAKYGCATQEAAALWFRYFDTWAFEGSPNRLLMEQTYSATYTARAVFYISRALMILFVLGLLSVGFSWYTGLYAPGQAVRRATVDAFVLACFLGAHVYLQLTNRIPSPKRPFATGCWARVDNVFGRSHTLLEQDVLRHATGLNEAFERVGSMRDALVKEAQVAEAARQTAKADKGKEPRVDAAASKASLASGPGQPKDA